MKTMSVWILLGAMLLGPSVLSGCGDASLFGGGNEFGATQGGVQDMGLARELIDNGRVPPPEAFVVEGMFSEHDLPLQGPACETLLCLRDGLGIAPALNGEQSAWLQVGLSSTIDPETYVRPSLTLIATVDVSGSMGWDYSEDGNGYPTPGALTRSLLRDLVARMGPGDQVAIVTYGSDVKTKLGLTPGDDHPTILRAIDGLREAGSTNMEGGMERAFQIARGASGTDEVRVMLFTDARPNVGASSASDFEKLASDMANHGIGMTVLGVGLGLGQEVFEAMSHLRGGNAFSLFSYEDANELFEDDWPWMVSPIAYDLNVELIPIEGIEIADAYGFPGEHATTAGFQVATVFLSKRKGALLLRLTNPALEDGLTGLRVLGRLSYESLTGVPVQQQFESVYYGQETDERGMFFEQPSVDKTVALAILVEGMRAAAEAYELAPNRAANIMAATLARFSRDAEALADPALEPEVLLAERLLELMEEGAPQGDLYGLR